MGAVAVIAVLAMAGCASQTGSGGQGNSGVAIGDPSMPGSTGALNPTPGSMSGVLGSAGATSTSIGQGGSSNGAMPCAVDMVVKSGCQLCHGATPIAGAPMSLLTLSDFTRDYTVKTTKQLLGQTMKMRELARIRINREMGTTQMPQSGALAADAFATLNGWLQGGAPAGMACAATGTAGMGSTQTPKNGMAGQGSVGNVGSGGSGGTVVPVGTPGANTQCSDPKAFDPLVADTAAGETCWEFQTHGQSAPGDKSKFTVPTGESYNQFYFDVPWPAGSLETRFGTVFDNKAVLHHWLMFTQGLSTAAGTVSPNVTGTTLLDGGAELIAGWAIGGCSTTYPKDVGVTLPSSGTLMIQWHHFNSTGAAAPDGSKVQICTVPAGMRAHVAGLTFLGTETIDIPAHAMGDATSTCTNNSGAPITIVGFTPHMHTIGSNMKSVVNKMGGMSETVFDKPFVFDQQINYMLTPQYVLQPGDSITTTCTWNNPNAAAVSFGQSTTAEMCYQFTVAYPYGALNNGVISLIGASNTCW
jgi:hypothetical protein